MHHNVLIHNTVNIQAVLMSWDLALVKVFVRDLIEGLHRQQFQDANILTAKKSQWFRPTCA
jgi:ribosome-binding factor A